jgi:hypothetical protein
LEEQLVCNQQVAGSSPVSSTSWISLVGGCRTALAEQISSRPDICPESDMTTTETTITPDLAPTDIGALLRGYELSLRARNRSPRTIMSYVQTVEIFRAFLVKVGMPTVVDRLTREHVEAFVADQLERWKPKTAHVRYGDLRRLSR